MLNCDILYLNKQTKKKSMFTFITIELIIVLSRPMLINVNNAFGKCPNKTDVVAVILLGSQLDIQCISHLFWV